MVKKFFAVLLGMSLFAVGRIYGAPVEEAIVELHITRTEFKPAPTKAKKAKERQTLPGHGICSGSFIDDSGDIITAGHCAEDAEFIDVQTFDHKVYRATIVAVSKTHDLALLHIDKRGTAHFLPADQIVRGEKVFIQGSPLGITDVLTTGIVAKLGGDEIFVDCAALPGNSGSPVYNETGQLVGVLNAVYLAGLGFSHLGVVQGVDSVWFFVIEVANQKK